MADVATTTMLDDLSWWAAALRTAMQGYLSFVEGAVLRWLERHELERRDLRELLIRAYGGAVRAAQELDPELSAQRTRRARSA